MFFTYKENLLTTIHPSQTVQLFDNSLDAQITHENTTTEKLFNLFIFHGTKLIKNHRSNVYNLAYLCCK